MPKLLYFRQDHDENKVMSRLATIAAGHGYINQAGPAVGQGNVAELLAAIANGEIALVLLPDEQRTWAAEWLAQQAAEQQQPLRKALETIASSL